MLQARASHRWSLVTIYPNLWAVALGFLTSEGPLSVVNGWVKTCCALPRRPVVRLVCSAATVLVSIMLLGPAPLSQSDSGYQGVSATDLARWVITDELRFQADHTNWMYRLEKEESGKKQVEEIIETKEGSLSRLLSIVEVRNENCSEQWTLRPQGRRLFKMLPDAFIFNRAGGDENLVKLSFKPKPIFHPPSLEARVFHDMEGEMWVDCKQERLAAFNGRLTQDVKFGLGLLGHLYKGGHVEVRRQKLFQATGIW